jgi:hypothetical protein
MSTRTIKELAQEAIDVQDACNASGVTIGFAAMAEDLRPYLSCRMSEHPIWRMWVSKLNDMANLGLGDFERFGEVYDACKVLAGIYPLRPILVEDPHASQRLASETMGDADPVQRAG